MLERFQFVKLTSTTRYIIDKFSFKEFEESAKKVYEFTIEAFKEGNESKFPRSSSKIDFHIRPKAINAEDTFEFTNGDFITKRTFWANKNTVETIINKQLNNEKKS